MRYEVHETDTFAEYKALKCEMEHLKSYLKQVEFEKEGLQKRVDELEKEKQFYLGQITAYKYTLTGGDNE